MSRPISRNSHLIITTLFAVFTSVHATADSHVRIVRLSYIEGGVQISHGSGQQYEKALLNLPVSEGVKLMTSDGRAEVEFEDGSTLRVVPESEIAFSELSLRDSGAKVSAIEVKKGTAYLNFAGTKDDEFSIHFGNIKTVLSHAAHLRVAIEDKDSSVSVFKGLIQVDCPSGSVEVKKHQTISFSSDHTQYTLAKNIHETPWDTWDDQQNEYHSQYAAKSYNNYSPYAYGTTDLAYYGTFFNAPGYGMMWQPYLAGAGWDPFMDGAWAFNPGFGFGWVSAYPWGWTPYHYGTWVFLPGRGWGWQPGGAWNAIYTQPRVLNAPAGFRVPATPASGTKTVVVNRGTASTFVGNKLILRSNSAGLGVPRGEFQNMARLSQKTQERGVVAQRMPMEPASAARGGSLRAAEPMSHMSSMSAGTSTTGSHSTGASPHK